MAEIRKSVENSALEAALYKYKNSTTDANKFVLLDEILRAQFLIPVTFSPERAENSAASEKVNADASFVCLANEENERFLMAFSSLNELNKLEKAENLQTLVLAFDEIAAILSDTGTALAGMVIDPYGNDVQVSNELAAYLKEHQDNLADETV